MLFSLDRHRTFADLHVFGNLISREKSLNLMTLSIQLSVTSDQCNALITGHYQEVGAQRHDSSLIYTVVY